MKKINRCLFFILLNTLIVCKIYGQNNLIASINLSIEKHDKRLFNFSNKESLLALHPEFFGSYNASFSLVKKVKEDGGFLIYSGLIFTIENKTFTRPFDHRLFEKDQLEILRNLNRYSKLNAGLKTNIDYIVSNSIVLRVNAQFLFTVFNSANFKGSSSEVFPYQMWNFKVNSFSLTPEFVYILNDLQFGLGARALNISTVDKVIFGRWINNDFSNKSLDLYNPFKLVLSISKNF